MWAEIRPLRHEGLRTDAPNAVRNDSATAPRIDVGAAHVVVLCVELCGVLVCRCYGCEQYVLLVVSWILVLSLLILLHVDRGYQVCHSQ